MNDLRRELAPVTDEAWKYIEQEIRRNLTIALSARRIVDFSGPHGWNYSAINLGKAGIADETFAKSVQMRSRTVQPLVELRSPFELLRDDLDSISRGASDANIQPAIDAALALAHAEDRMVYYGRPESGFRGICEAAPHPPLELPPDHQSYPHIIADAMEALREAGVHGPYAIALDSAGYTALSKTTVGGFPVLMHVQRMLDGPVIWAPMLNGAVVLSIRKGDFELVVGRDISIGYLDHDIARVRFYLEESIAFRVLSPEAAITIKRPAV
jgi:uncharacterized linocin/CFP29 family protein